MGFKLTQFYERTRILGIFTTISILPNHVTYSKNILTFVLAVFFFVSSTRKPSKQTININPFHFHSVTTIGATKETYKLSKRVFNKKSPYLSNFDFFFFLETKNTLAKISGLSSNTLKYARKKISQ